MLKEPTQPTPVENDTAPVGRDAGYGDRILIWCFIASILVNLGFAFWLNYADIYGTKRVAQEQKQMKLHVYKPPVKQKPKPKPKPKPKIIPPKPIKIVHKLPPPRPTPHPPPPAPRAPSLGHTSKSHTAINVGPTTSAPPEAVPQTPGIDTRPQAPVSAPPAPPPAVIPPPAPPAPPVKAPPAPPVHHNPPPPPPPPVHPPGYSPTATQDAGVDDIGSPDVSNIDPSTITGSCVISFRVNTSGGISDVRVKKSSGNSDFDDACKRIISQGHGVPGIQDHIKYDASCEHVFNVNG